MDDRKSSARVIAKKGLMVQVSVMAILCFAGKSALAQSLACPQPLLFGEIIPCGTANTVVVTPANTRSVNGCLTSTGAPFSRARCTLSQTPPLRPIKVSVTASSYTLTNGTSSMKVNAFNLATAAGGKTYTKTAFAFSVPIGATLSVGASQPDGTYSGAFTVNAVLQ